MQLEGEDAVQQCLGMPIGEVQDELVIHVVPDVVALGDDDDIVPVIELEEFLEAFGIDQLLGDLLLAILSADSFFTHHAGSAAPPGGAALVIDKTGHARQLVLVANLMLVALHAPLIRSLTGGEVF